eukprot:6135815-Amphidinium_carterae.1
MQYSSNGVLQWTQQRGTSNSDFATGVAVSVDGQVYVTGYTEGSLDGQSSAGDNDAFLMQYSSNGVWRWTQQRGTSSLDEANGVAVSVDGQVYMAGGTEGSLDGAAFLMKFEGASSTGMSTETSSPSGGSH